ncbi:LPS export ABC transporter permease LptF [Halioxenophilus aromaticivorans]|uniref:LPS export ABC transporter permease LptF n=1 Tax=Halioxenophilus aromaticivorans TaxID=1306992 RepID=UPI0031ED0BF5
MIIFRYLTREILTSTLAVSVVLLLVIVSSRFGRYLNEAVSGRISADVLFSVILLRIPSIMELVVPLSFFIAILFALGRLYIDSEITALNACGYSRKRILGNVCGPALIVAGFVALLSLWLSPLSLDASNSILEQEKARSEFETLGAGEFQVLGGSGSVIFTESISGDRKQLNNVFAAIAKKATENDAVDLGSESGTRALIKAQSAEQVYDSQYQRKYLRINDGQRVEGEPGQPGFRVVDFQRYEQLIEQPEIRVKAAHDRVPTLALFGKDDAASQAALHWRLGLPVLVLMLALLGVPLAATDPRKGRYTKMIPAIVLYMMYLVALNATRGAIEDGKVSALALWAVHIAAAVIGLFLFNAQALGRRKGRRKQKRGGLANA